MRLEIEIPNTYRPGLTSKAPGPRIRSVDEAQVIAVIESLGLEWKAPEQHTKARPPRRAPVVVSRPARRRREQRLMTQDVLDVIPASILAELMQVEPSRFRNWGVNVPTSHEAWLRDLMDKWPLLKVVREELKSGTSPLAVARKLGKRAVELANLCAEFGVDWPQD